MGTGLLNFVRSKISKEQKVAFIVTFIFTLLVHLYKFTNTLLNHDAMYNVYASQNMIGSGRWALQLACGLSSFYDLPWVIGVLCCLYIALTAAIIVALFRIRNPILIFLTGGLLASSPATIETFFFLFTADGYMIAMVLAALAVYLSRVEEKRISMYVLSGICLCVSCGIYQAYVSFGLLLALCHLIYELMRNQHKPREYYLWILRQVLIFGLSLATYYVIWQVVLGRAGVSASNYQGISEVGTVSLDLLKHGLKNAYEFFTYYFFQLAAWGNPWSLYGMLNVLLLAALALGVILAAVKSGLYRRPWAMALVILCLVAVIPFAGMWCFTSYSVYYRPMMLQSLMLLYLLAGLLYEEWGRGLVKDAAGLLLAVIVLHSALLANISYFYMNLCYERTYADAVEMAAEIHNVEDEAEYTDVAVLGNRYNQYVWDYMDSSGTELSREGEMYLLTGLLEKNLLVDVHQITGFLSWYMGMDMVNASEETYNALTTSQEVREMPCWPADGAIKVVDGTLVIKISELE